MRTIPTGFEGVFYMLFAWLATRSCWSASWSEVRRLAEVVEVNGQVVWMSKPRICPSR